MTTANYYFTDFLKNIRLSQNQIKDLAKGHNTLRTRLSNDEDLSSIIETTYLQGSYKRNTAVKPKNGKRSDVDIIVVTNLDSEKLTPDEALEMFVPFLEKYYPDKYEINQRSIGITLSYVDLDLVITAKIKDEETLKTLKNDGNKMQFRFQKMISDEQFDVSDFNDFFFNIEKSQSDSTEPILIPDTQENNWTLTNPLAQINWTLDKNKRCNGHYINIVKAMKWWKKQHETPKYPKGYPLEHLIGQACPDDTKSVAEGITDSLELIVSKYPTKPVLIDHGVETHDVFKRITNEEYEEFYELICEAAKTAREAFDEQDFSSSVNKWREIFGSEFPPPKNPNSSSEKFTPRNSVTEEIGSARFG